MEESLIAVGVSQHSRVKGPAKLVESRRQGSAGPAISPEHTHHPGVGARKGLKIADALARSKEHVVPATRDLQPSPGGIAVRRDGGVNLPPAIRLPREEIPLEHRVCVSKRIDAVANNRDVRLPANEVFRQYSEVDRERRVDLPARRDWWRWRDDFTEGRSSIAVLGRLDRQRGRSQCQEASDRHDKRWRSFSSSPRVESGSKRQL